MENLIKISFFLLLLILILIVVLITTLSLKTKTKSDIINSTPTTFTFTPIPTLISFLTIGIITETNDILREENELWISADFSPFDIIPFDSVSYENTVMVGGQSNETPILFSRDNGETWQASIFNPVLPTTLPNTCWSLATSKNGIWMTTVHISGESTYVYRSEDDGSTWFRPGTIINFTTGYIFHLYIETWAFLTPENSTIQIYNYLGENAVFAISNFNGSYVLGKSQELNIICGHATDTSVSSIHILALNQLGNIVTTTSATGDIKNINVKKIANFQNKWVGVGTSIIFSNNGYHWGRASGHKFLSYGNDIVVSNSGRWVAVGKSSNGNTILISKNGYSWRLVQGTTFSVEGISVTTDNHGKWVAIGDNGINENISLISEDDGITWNTMEGVTFNEIIEVVATPAPIPVISPIPPIPPTLLTSFLTIGTETNDILREENELWISTDLSPFDIIPFDSVSYANTVIVGGRSNETPILFSRDNGETWQASIFNPVLPTTLPNTCWSLATSKNGIWMTAVHIPEEGSDAYIYRSEDDGSTWFRPISGFLETISASVARVFYLYSETWIFLTPENDRFGFFVYSLYPLYNYLQYDTSNFNGSYVLGKSQELNIICGHATDTSVSSIYILALNQIGNIDTITSATGDIKNINVKKVSNFENKWVGVGTSIIFSNNGYHWVRASGLKFLSYGNDIVVSDSGRWVAVGKSSNGNTILISNNGYNWSLVQGTRFSVEGISVTTDNQGKWVAIGDNGINENISLISEDNGITWNIMGGETFNEGIEVIAV